MLIDEKYFLDKDYQFVGKWWLPENPDNQVIGVLKFTQDTIILELEGTLVGEERDVIYGYASGRKISLYDTFPAKTTIAPAFSSNPNFDSDYYPSSHICNQILLNTHVPSLKDHLIENAIISYGKTKLWTKFTGLTSRESNGERFTYEYRYARPDALALYKDSDIELNIINNFRLPGASHLEEETTIFEENIFLFENLSKLKGLFFFDHMSALRHFISIASQFSFSPCHIQLTEPNGARSHLLFRVNPIEHLQTSDKLNITLFLFDLSNIEKEPLFYYTNWYRFFQGGGDVSHLYFKKKSIPHENFLALAQALEHFFEINHSKNLKVSEYSKKIAFLFREYGKGLEDLVNEDSFSRMMSDSRNYYAHFMTKKKIVALKGGHLTSLSSLANYLVSVCLLTQFGFSIEESIKRNARQLSILKDFVVLPC